jgi:uncharacterized RDD family membrane protein YckC
MHSAIAPQLCVSCGNELTSGGDFCPVCGCLLNDPEKQRDLTPSGRSVSQAPPTLYDEFGNSLPRSYEYAGFWRRVWAGLFDISLEFIVALLLTLLVDIIAKTVGRSMGIAPESTAYLAGITFIVVLTVGAWLYCAFSESSRYRATLGKRLVGLEVVNTKGGKLSFGQASVRHLLKFLSLFTAGIGFMMAGWTKRRQALHDMPNDCLVVRIHSDFLSLFGR